MQRSKTNEVKTAVLLMTGEEEQNVKFGETVHWQCKKRTYFFTQVNCLRCRVICLQGKP